MNYPTFRAYLDCYQDLAHRVIFLAHHDVLNGENKLDMLKWLKQNEDKKDSRTKKKRISVEKKLSLDKDARQFLSSEYFEFWQAIVDLHNT